MILKAVQFLTSECILTHKAQICYFPMQFNTIRKLFRLADFQSLACPVWNSRVFSKTSTIHWAVYSVLDAYHQNRALFSLICLRVFTSCPVFWYLSSHRNGKNILFNNNLKAVLVADKIKQPSDTHLTLYQIGNV